MLTISFITTTDVMFMSATLSNISVLTFNFQNKKKTDKFQRKEQKM